MSEETPRPANGRWTNNEIAAHVTEKMDGLEGRLDLKLSALRWQGVAALAGGQALAGLIAALITRTTPAEVVSMALRVLS